MLNGVFNAREVSTALWVVLLLAFVIRKPQVRESLKGLLRSAPRWKVGLTIVTVELYVALGVFGLWAVGLWDASLLKDTVLWALTVPTGMLLSLGSITRERQFFQSAILKGYSFTVLLETFLNAYVFSLPVELVFVPFVALVSSVLVVAGFDPQHKQVATLMQWVLTIIAVVMVGHAALGAYSSFTSWGNVGTMTKVALPVALTTILVPFVWAFANVAAYEMLFVRLHYLIPNPKLRRFARRHIVLSYRSDFRALEDLGRQIALKRPQSDIELKQVVAGARRAARESGDERKKSRGASPTVGDVHPRTNPDLARTAADNV